MTEILVLPVYKNCAPYISFHFCIYLVMVTWDSCSGLIFILRYLKTVLVNVAFIVDYIFIFCDKILQSMRTTIKVTNFTIVRCISSSQKYFPLPIPNFIIIL